MLSSIGAIISIGFGVYAVLFGLVFGFWVYKKMDDFR